MRFVTRLQRIQKEIAAMRDARFSHDHIAQFLEAYGSETLMVSTADLERVAVGDWETVELPFLKRVKDAVHRSRWEAAAPVILLAVSLGDEDFSSGDDFASPNVM